MMPTPYATLHPSEKCDTCGKQADGRAAIKTGWKSTMGEWTRYQEYKEIAMQYQELSFCHGCDPRIT